MIMMIMIIIIITIITIIMIRIICNHYVYLQQMDDDEVEIESIGNHSIQHFIFSAGVNENHDDIEADADDTDDAKDAQE